MKPNKVAQAQPDISTTQLSEALLPSPSDNAVITALKTLGLYKKSSAPFKHEITCPWVNEHTDAKNGGTVYFEPNGKYYAGGFKCQHTHCLDRTLKHLIEILERLIAELEAGAK
jgi:hypothetical protein